MWAKIPRIYPKFWLYYKSTLLCTIRAIKKLYFMYNYCCHAQIHIIFILHDYWIYWFQTPNPVNIPWGLPLRGRGGGVGIIYSSRLYEAIRGRDQRLMSSLKTITQPPNSNIPRERKKSIHLYDTVCYYCLALYLEFCV